jgi:hypothetical protein
MNFNISIEAKDVARVALRHPDTKEALGAFLLAGPDHEATQNFRRENIDRIQRPDYKEDPDKFEMRLLLARTVGWEGIKDAGTGEEVPFDASALPGLYKQSWLRQQVLAALGDEGLFYRE